MLHDGAEGVGRSAYICPNLECAERARKSRGVERTLKRMIQEDESERFWNELKCNLR